VIILLKLKKCKKGNFSNCSYDGNYYVTSAKIDHGNSGGTAILVNNDCYIGIPSASVVGSVDMVIMFLASLDIP